MRILALVTDAFGGVGGIAKFNRDFLTALCSLDDCSEVVAIPRIMPGAAETLPRKLKYVTGALNNRIVYGLACLRAALSKPRFSLIVCGHIHLLPIAWLVKLWTKATLILIVYGVESWRPSKRFLIKHLIRQVDVFISISKFTKKAFVAWSEAESAKVKILYSSVNRDVYKPEAKNFELLTRHGLAGKKIILTLGRMEEGEKYKGFDEVMEIMPVLIQENPDFVYLIVGDGTDRKRLESKAKSLSISDHVIFTGFVPESEKADYYRLADVFILASWGEGFGIALLEAMACGVPVIASKTDGTREAVLNGKLGALVDPQNPSELKAEIVKAISDPKKNPHAELEQFSYPVFEARVHEILRKIGNMNTIRQAPNDPVYAS